VQNTTIEMAVKSNTGDEAGPHRTGDAGTGARLHGAAWDVVERAGDEAGPHGTAWDVDDRAGEAATRR
jgi:hypothetical protein